jgi:hypothetical protein
MAKQLPPTDQIVTDDMVSDAVHQLSESIIPIGEAKGRMVKAEAMLRHVKAVNMSFSPENAVTAQERDAYASNAYRDAIQEFTNATVAFEILKAEREFATQIISIWQSQNANMRALRV